jgi:hypothetical protein
MDDVDHLSTIRYVRVNNVVLAHLGVLELKEQRVLGVIHPQIKGVTMENMMENPIKDKTPSIDITN